MKMRLSLGALLTTSLFLCACNDRVEIGKDNPDAGVLDAAGNGQLDAAYRDGTELKDHGPVPAVCTPGIDQTCNDDPIVSAIWGACTDNGTCTCLTGFEVNPTTGRCRPTCQSQIDALAQEMYTPATRSCTAIVRLDHDTLTVIGYQLVCGAYAAVDETKARAAAQQDTGYGATGDKMLNAANPEGVYIFSRPAGDFGGVGVVSSRTGLSVFGGSVVWAGTGDISYPAGWRTQGFGQGCGPMTATTQPVPSGYDLVNEAALGSSEVGLAWAAVEKTAIPAAIWQGGYLFDITVIRYPRSVGAFDPSTAEWVVFLTGGWLE